MLLIHHRQKSMSKKLEFFDELIYVPVFEKQGPSADLKGLYAISEWHAIAKMKVLKNDRIHQFYSVDGILRTLCYCYIFFMWSAFLSLVDACGRFPVEKNILRITASQHFTHKWPFDTWLHSLLQSWRKYLFAFVSTGTLFVF